MDDRNRLDLPLFKSSEETYFVTRRLHQSYLNLTIGHLGGHKQASIQNYGNETSRSAKKGITKTHIRNNRTYHRQEINKKRLHDAILRFGILKM